MKAKTVMEPPAVATPVEKRPVQALGVFLFLAVAVCASLYLYNPPSPSAGTAPPSEFSSQRAMAHLQEVARSPRPMGTLRHSEVRDYIVKELTGLGLTPQVQKATAVTTRLGSPYPAATVHNILARLPGSESTKAVMIASHYDSVPTGPGANDDGCAVAAMLETARALKSGPGLLNDVIFLFTDGEEPGLLGAQAFVDEHPWVKDVGLVLNLEARGSQGPSIMFETSDQNGWLIDQYAGAATHPIASSLTYDLYKLLPSDTDFTIFRKAGLPGLNFAYIGKSIHYHTAADNLLTVDEATLHHHGANALALARHFGGVSLEDRRREDAVYFNLLGSFIVRYPAWAAIPLTLAISLAFAAVLIFGMMRKRLMFGAVSASFFFWLLASAAAALAASIIWGITVSIHSQYLAIPFGDTYNSAFYMLALVALVVALGSALFNLAGRWISLLDLAMGALLCWLMLMVLTSLYLPGVSYLFTWPLVFGLVCVATLVFAKEPDQLSGSQVALLLICAAPSVLLVVPNVYQILLALTISSSEAVMVLVMLLLALFAPLLSLMLRPYKWLLPSAAFAACLVLLVAGSLTSGAGETSPQPNHIFYASNADAGTSAWASTDERPDEWTSQFLSGEVQRGPLTEYAPMVRGDFLKAEAPAISVEAPKMEVLEKKNDGGLWTLKARISSPRRAEVISVSLEGVSEVVSASVNGKGIDASADPFREGPDSRWSLIFYAPDDAGLELYLQARATQPIKLVVMDRSYGLPEAGGNPIRPRPGHLMPAPFAFSDSTLVTKSFTIQ